MKKIFVVCFFICLVIALRAQAVYESDKYVPETDSLVLKNLAKWQDIKFGLLMHWGTYSEKGIVESWTICPEDEGWCRRSNNDYYAYVKEYEGLKNTFYPTKFDPDLWAEAAKEAGMKYVVFTTKHHDGFCMFDTKYTDYKVTSKDCPFHTNPRANIAKEVFIAFRKKGFMIGAYFSKPDWHCPYYWWPNFPPRDRNVNYDPDVYKDRWNKFVEYTHNQILELMSDYGKIDILWLDGGWIKKLSKEEIKKEYEKKLSNIGSGYLKSNIISQDIKMDELVKQCREKQPGLIVVDRDVYGKNQDYLTPENRVPDKTLPYPWESCITSGGGWSYTPNAKYMSGREGIQLLINIVSKGGNLLLNIAPGPDGTWQQGAYNLLKEFGAWMKVNSEAIYNSKPLSPYIEGNIAMTCQSNGNAYFFYLAKKGEEVPAIIHIVCHRPAKGVYVTMLGEKMHLRWEPEGVEGFKVMIPASIRKNPPCDNAWTIKVSSLQPSK
jgi:alpha-L-fucosidase